MGKLKHYVEDFLDIVNNEMRETYAHKEWDMGNLPDLSIMEEVILRFKNRKGKEK